MRKDVPVETCDHLPVVAGGFDAPGSDAVVRRGAVLVSGWAYNVDDLVSRIDLFLGHDPLGPALLCRPRADVARALDDDGAELSGFELLVDLSRVETNGDEWLSAIVTLLSGAKACLPSRRLRIDTPPSPATPGTLEGAAATPERPQGWGRRRQAPSRTDLRILWHERSFGHGGSQLRLRETIEYLSARGGFSHTVVAPGDGPLRDELATMGCSVVSIPQTSMSDPAAYEKSVAGMASLARDGYDLVFGWTLTSFHLLDAAGRLGLPAIWRIGEAEPLRSVVRWLSDDLHPMIEERARRVSGSVSLGLCNSFAARDVLRANGFHGRFAVQWTGVDVVGVRAYVAAVDKELCRHSLNVPPGRRLLVFPAMIWPPKGQLSLVSALARAQGRKSLICAFIGSPHDEYVELIRRQVERCDLIESVRIVPFQDDVWPWFRAADVAVCASESESLPASVLEAMAFGLPILATRVGDVPLLLGESEAGWVCERNDLGSMIECLERIVRTSDEKLATMGAAGADRVDRHHNRAVVEARFAELLASVSQGAIPDWLAVGTT